MVSPGCIVPVSCGHVLCPACRERTGRNPFDTHDPRYYTFLTEPHPGGVDGTMDAMTVSYAGDYGLVEKYHTAHYDCMTRVPLIMRAPGGQARRVVQPVGPIDLPATIAELAGVELGYSHHSTSLVDLMNGGREDPDAMVFAENGFNTDEMQGFDLLSVTTKGSSFPEGSDYYPQSKQVTEHRESYPRTLMARTATEKLILRPRVLNWMILTSDTIPTDHDPRFWETPAWRRDG